MPELSIASETTGNKILTQILTKGSTRIGGLLRGKRNELKKGFRVGAFFTL